MPETLGPFQLDNLVKGRIPFAFISHCVDISEVYAHVHKYHLEAMRLPLPEGDISAATVVKTVQSRGYPLEFAIVILCDDGEKSAEWAAALEQAGYKNVFSVHGGWKQFLEEYRAGF